MIDYSSLTLLVLGFVDGLLFGLAIKKGLVSFVLLVVAFLISGYVGFSFVPKISLSNLISTASSYAMSHLGQLGTLTHIGTAGSLSLLVILFAVGLAVGIWKG